MLAGVSEIVRFKPSAALRGYVTPFAGFALDTVSGSEHYGVPRPSVTVSMAFGDHALEIERGNCDRSSFWMLVGGLSLSPIRIGQQDGFYGLQFRIDPLATRNVLGVPAAALGGMHVDLNEFIRVDHERLAELDWGRRFAVLEESLIRAAANHQAGVVHPELAQAWSMIMTSHGLVRIAACAEVVGWSRRRLTDRFSGEFGVSPKELARLARLRRCQTLVAQGVSLAEAAHRCGFADQPHMTRDWSALAGQTPTSWRRDQQRHAHQFS